jgi:hypothetical protein
MELEQRVQMLEQELEILKSQIQATLLDIQEQLLTNAYPSLRADDATNDGGYSRGGGGGTPAPVPPRNDSRPPTQDGFSNVRRVTFDESGEAFEQAGPPPQMPAPPPVRPQAAVQVQAPAPRQETVETDWSTLSELEEWATEKVKEMGPRRTRKLIEMHYRKGHFDDEVKEMLVGLISLYEEESAPSQPKPAPVVKARPASPQPAPKPVRQEQPAPRPQARRSAPPTDETQPRQPAQPDGPTPYDEDEDPQNLVLKLIAGVQNAGAGVTRRKKNG